MSNCGCTPSTPDPVVPAPPICGPVDFSEPADPNTPCCLACVYDELDAAWTKPAEGASAFLSVCDSSRYLVGQCVFVKGTNGLGGVYSVTALLDGAIEVTPQDGEFSDVGGPGNVVGERVYILPKCPMTNAELVALIESLFPDEFALEVHPDSDTGNGFEIEAAANKMKLVFDPVAFAAAVQNVLNFGGLQFYPTGGLGSITFAQQSDIDDVSKVVSGSYDTTGDAPPNAAFAILRVTSTLFFRAPFGSASGDLVSAQVATQLIGGYGTELGGCAVNPTTFFPLPTPDDQRLKESSFALAPLAADVFSWNVVFLAQTVVAPNTPYDGPVCLVSADVIGYFAPAT